MSSHLIITLPYLSFNSYELLELFWCDAISSHGSENGGRLRFPVAFFHCPARVPAFEEESEMSLCRDPRKWKIMIMQAGGWGSPVQCQGGWIRSQMEMKTKTHLRLLTMMMMVFNLGKMLNKSRRLIAWRTSFQWI